MAIGGKVDIVIPKDGPEVGIDPDEAPFLTAALNNLSHSSAVVSRAISDSFGYVTTTDSANGFVAGGCTSYPLVQPSTSFPPLQGTPPMTGMDWSFPPTESPCKEYHVLTEELLQVEDDEVVGTCGRCGIRVFVPRIAGAFSFERAGAFIGRAMSLDSEDPEENLAELMTELAVLEKQIKRDQARLERSREILVIARNMARKHSVKELVG